MNYQSCLTKLYALNRYQKIKYDLDNVRKLAAAYGDPQQKLQVVHVTGTNGKGSVAFKVAKLFEKSGYKTGMFTSPHLTTFRERFQINGKKIEKEQVTEFLQDAFRRQEQLGLHFSFFELLTVLAFKHFADSKVDVVSLEVGIGGRLDCTNIVESNLLAVLTSVGLDHCEILGGTEELITREKCGLIKRNSPTVIGPDVDASIVHEFCSKLNSPMFQVQKTNKMSFFDINKGIARMCGEVLNKHWSYNLKIDEETLDLNLPGRAERVDIDSLTVPADNQPAAVYLDVGHNPMAVKFLCEHMRNRHPNDKFVIVFGTSGLKNSADMLRSLKTLSDNIYLIEADSPRAKPIDALKADAESIGADIFKCIGVGKISDTLTHVLQSEQLHGKVLLICGSFFIMPEVRACLGLKDETDEFFLNEYSLETLPPFRFGN